MTSSTKRERPHNLEVEDEMIRPPKEEGKPPRPATEPPRKPSRRTSRSRRRN